MKIWLVTTGSSDVQLTTDEHWREWFRPIQHNYYRLPFEPTQIIPDDDVPYRVPPRVLGDVYETRPEEVWEYLTFPLLQEFTKTLQAESIEKIILLLTDQENIFDDEERNNTRCPYWQDTCTLLPIFERYFQEYFPATDLVPVFLRPNAGELGLDDWNHVLEVVREALATVEVELTTVYVSHQAGTPAISSAVQFTSLARFRGDVQFLVSNEYRPEQTRTISQSTYLHRIQLQEAKALLNNRDYVGVQDLLGLSQSTSLDIQKKRLKYLLEAGIQWNFAEFYKFKDILNKRSLLAKEPFPWWRLGYESAYLAFVRLHYQGDTVEALFHSFRAIEGTINKWVISRYPDYIQEHPKYGPQIRISICDKLPTYFDSLSETDQTKFKKWGNIGLYGVPLVELLKKSRPDWVSHPDINVVWDTTKDMRNVLFHRIEGLQAHEVFEAWETDNEQAWKQRLLNCLNFISEQSFDSLEEASLMVRVHQELEKAIAQL